MKKPKIMISGCGVRSSVLLRHVQSQVEITAICDPNREAIDLFKKKFNGDYLAFSDYEEMMRAPSAPWVMITSPNDVHEEQAVKAFSSGCNVFLEKPLGTTIESIKKIILAYNKSNVKLMTGFVLRYSEFYRRIKDIVSGGGIGRVISFEFNETLHFQHGGHIMRNEWRRHSRRSGGHLLEKCCHDIDIANWIIESRPARVSSFGGRRIFIEENAFLERFVGDDRDGIPAYRGWRILNDSTESPFFLDGDVVDHQVAIIEYENKVLATFHTNLNAACPERRFYILGTTGSITADLITGKIEKSEISLNKNSVDCSMSGMDGHGGGDSVIMNNFVRIMNAGGQPATGVKEGVDSAISAISIQNSMSSGSVVSLASIWDEIDDLIVESGDRP